MKARTEMFWMWHWWQCLASTVTIEDAEDMECKSQWNFTCSRRPQRKFMDEVVYPVLNGFMEGPGSRTCDRVGATTIEDCQNCRGTGGCTYGKETK